MLCITTTFYMKNTRHLHLFWNTQIYIYLCSQIKSFMKPQSRNPHFDNLKLILIFLVVFGHAIEYIGNTSRISNAVYSFIYTFHMPLFVFISGYFTNVTKSFSSSLKILETYLVLQIISQLIGGGLSLTSMFIPQWTLWYLVSLSCWRFGIGLFSNHILRNKYTSITIAFILSLLAGFIPIQSFISFQRTFYFFPFFILGFISRQCGWYEMTRTINAKVAYVALSTIFIILLAYGDNIGRGFFGISLYDLNQNLPLQLVAKTSKLVISTMVSVCIINCIPNLGKISQYGAITLFIYAYHTYAIKVFRYVFGGDLNILIVTIATILMFATLIILSKFKPMTFILNPISNLIKFRGRL